MRIESAASWAGDRLFAEALRDTLLLTSALTDERLEDRRIRSLASLWNALATGDLERSLAAHDWWQEYRGRRRDIRQRHRVASEVVSDLRAARRLAAAPDNDAAPVVDEHGAPPIIEPVGQQVIEIVEEDEEEVPYVPEVAPDIPFDFTAEPQRISDPGRGVALKVPDLALRKERLLAQVDHRSQREGEPEARLNEVDIHVAAHFLDPSWGKDLSAEQRAFVVEEVLRARRSPWSDLPSSYAWSRVRALARQGHHIGSTWVFSDGEDATHVRLCGYSLLGTFRTVDASRDLAVRVEEGRVTAVFEDEHAMAKLLVFPDAGIARGVAILRGLPSREDARKAMAELCSRWLPRIVEPAEPAS